MENTGYFRKGLALLSATMLLLSCLLMGGGLSVLAKDEEITNYYQQDFDALNTGDVLDLNTDSNTIIVSDTYARSGTKSIKVSASNMQAWSRPQMPLTNSNGSAVTLTVGKSYRVSLWAYIPTGSRITKVQFWVAQPADNSTVFTSATYNGAVIGANTSTDVPAGTWTQISYDIDTAAWGAKTFGTYLRLGICGNVTGSPFYVDDLSITDIPPYSQGYEAFEAMEYADGNTSKIAGNGSGRTVSDHVNHTEGGSKSLRLKLNQNADSNYARTLINQKDELFRGEAGKGYAVTFWAYWDPAENAGTASTEENNLDLHYNLGSSSSSSNITGHTFTEATAITAIPARTWVQLRIGIGALSENCGNTPYITIGALALDSSPDCMRYLYIDDVRIASLDTLYTGDAVVSPRVAALFCSGSTGGRFDPAMQDGFAVYYSDKKQKEFAAMRIFGEYVTDGKNLDSVMIDNYQFNVYERGLLLGDSTATADTLTLDGDYIDLCSTSGNDLKKYWDLDENTGKVRYSMLLRDIPSSKADTAYTFRPYIKVGTAEKYTVLYGELQTQLILNTVYANVCARLGDSPKFFGSLNGTADYSALPMKDGFDARFTLVYPSNSSTVPSMVSSMKERMDAAFDVQHELKADTDAADTYEILVGKTNRPETAAAQKLLTDSTYDFIIKLYGTKLVIVASMDEYLELGIQYFMRNYCCSNATLDKTLSYLASQNWRNPPIAGTPITDYYIRTEKYPSLMVMEAVDELQKQIEILTGKKLQAIAYNGSHHNHEIWVGPYQDAIKAKFDGSAYNYLIGVNDNGLLEDKCAHDEYKVWFEDGKLKINGGSSYAINAGVSALCDLLATSRGGELANMTFEDPNDTSEHNYHIDDGEIALNPQNIISVSVSREQNSTPNGKRSMKMVSTNWSGANRPQLAIANESGSTVSVTQGEAYDISFKVYWDANNTSNNFRFWLAANTTDACFTTGAAKDACKIYETSGDMTLKPGEWNTVTVSIPDCAHTGYLYLGATCGAMSALSTFYIDDFAITESGGIPSTVALSGKYDGGYSLTDDYSLTFADDFDYTGTPAERENSLLINWSCSHDTTPGPTKTNATDADGNPIELWDEQQRPAKFGKEKGCSYYVEDGCLYEITEYVSDLTYQSTDNKAYRGTETGPGYIAGRVTSERRWNYSYGILECRIVMAMRNGACSAVWNCSAANVSNGRHLEIDLYENFGEDKFVANVHSWGSTEDGWSGSHQYGGKIYRDGTKINTRTIYAGGSEESGELYYDTFHYIAYRWTRTYIAFYMDGVEFGRLYYTNMTTAAGDDLVMGCPVWLRLANGVGTQNYSGYDPHDWLTKTEKKKRNHGCTITDVSQFREVQVVDSVYLFQQNDGISTFTDLRK